MIVYSGFAQIYVNYLYNVIIIMLYKISVHVLSACLAENDDEDKLSLLLSD